MTSKSASRRPSISTTLPSSTTRLGAGSLGPSIATSPSSGYGDTSSSRRSSRCSRDSNRLDLRPFSGKQPPLRVHVLRLAHECRGQRRLPLRLEPARPLARAPRQTSDSDGAPCRPRGSSRTGRSRARPRARGCRRAEVARQPARSPPGAGASRESRVGPPPRCDRRARRRASPRRARGRQASTRGRDASGRADSPRRGRMPSRQSLR